MHQDTLNLHRIHKSEITEPKLEDTCAIIWGRGASHVKHCNLGCTQH